MNFIKKNVQIKYLQGNSFLVEWERWSTTSKTENVTLGKTIGIIFISSRNYYTSKSSSSTTVREGRYGTTMSICFFRNWPYLLHSLPSKGVHFGPGKCYERKKQVRNR